MIVNRSSNSPLDPWLSPLVDSFGRVHTNLRISITDRCNIRCFYCMPQEVVQFVPRDDLLTYEEIERFVRVVARLGVNKVRLTGGEPLVRKDVPELVRRLAAVPGIADLALTTNGVLLGDLAAELRAAGLHRLNISLDTLREETFQKISRRQGIDRVLNGIFAAQETGFARIRLNAISIRGITEEEIVPLAEFARQNGLELRFIEYMPLDADGRWAMDQVLGGDQVRAIIDREVGRLEPIRMDDPSQPATDYRYLDGGGRVGFINPVTHSFCGDCNRLRLTAEGQVRNCLFSTVEWDARALLRGGAADAEIADLVRASIAAKKRGHGIDTPDFIKPQRAMYQIGG
jgi:cyclic pyranopterin phosphate synthase